MSISERLQDIESFFARLAEADGFEVYVDTEGPASDDDIAEVEKALGYPVPAQVATMWRRGFVSTSGTMEHDSFVAIGRDFCSPSVVLRELGTLREVAKQWEGREPPEPATPTAEFVRLAREGFPLSFENPVLASDASGAIYLLNYKDCDARKVGDSLSDHLTAWLAAGAFSQLDDEAGQVALLDAVRALLPAWAKVAGPNVWLDTYRALYFT